MPWSSTGPPTLVSARRILPGGAAIPMPPERAAARRLASARQGGLRAVIEERERERTFGRHAAREQTFARHPREQLIRFRFGRAGYFGEHCRVHLPTVCARDIGDRGHPC